MRDRSRRDVLRAVAAGAVGLAGCTTTPSTSGPDGRSPSDERTPATGTPAAATTSTAEEPLPVGETYRSPRNGTSVTVREVVVTKQTGSTSVGSSTHVDVACVPGHQFVTLDVVATDGSGDSVLSDLRFAVTVDGVAYPEPGDHWYWSFPRPTTERPGKPAVAVPVAEASDATAVLRRDDGPDVRWRLGTETVARLARAPSFAVESFAAPDAVERGSHYDVTFTVANDGDRDGRFLAEVGGGPLSDHPEVGVPVPAGGRRTVTETVAPGYPERATALDATLEWGCGSLVRSVRVEG